MNVKTIISRYAGYYGDKTAIVYQDKRLSFKEVNRRSNRLANGLSILGVDQNSRIGTILNNCSEYIETMFAKHKLGAVDVILSPRISTADMAFQINDAQVDTLVVGSEYIDKLPALSDLPVVKNRVAVGQAPAGWTDYEDLVSQGSPDEPAGEADNTELGHIVYSSGTTGKPKGIMWRRDSYLLVARNILLDMLPDLTKEDVFLGLQPIYHAVSSFVLPCWMRGATQVVTAGFGADNALDLIEREKVTVIKTIPTLINRYIEHETIRSRNFERIKAIIYGASPIATDKLRQALAIFGPVFIQNYGQSEMPMTICTLGRGAHITDGTPEQTALLASVGRPYSMVELKVTDDKGQAVADGEPGEITVRSDHAMMGYLNRPEATREKLVDGWIHTGDIGRLENGYVYLLDRKGEMIISGGLNIYPNEVEQVLMAHPAVLEACVFGVPDPDWQEAVKAVVVLKSGASADEAEVIDFCRHRLAAFKRPRSVEFREDLPKNAQGKILRRELKAPYWQGRSRAIGG